VPNGSSQQAPVVQITILLVPPDRAQSVWPYVEALNDTSVGLFPDKERRRPMLKLELPYSPMPIDFLE